MNFIVILIIFIIGYKIFFEQKIYVDIKSFLCRGFKKYDNAFGLFAYTGKQGKGKTYSAINFAIDQKLKYDYKILTNIKSFKVFDDTMYFDDIYQVIEYCTQFKDNDENVLILYDEIFTVLQKSQSMAGEILSFISQLRKRRIIFITTAQEWSEINITFRRYVRYQISCNMISLPLIKTAVLVNRHNDGDGIKWNNDTQDFEAPLIRTKISKAKRSVINSYDTYETIATNFKKPTRR